MNVYLLIAAILTFGIGAAHSWLGERYVIVPLLRRQDLPRLFGNDVFTRRTLRFAWHLTSLTWWGAGGVFIVVGSMVPCRSANAAVTVLAATFLVSGMITLAFSRGRHLAWIVFFGIAVAAWLGSH